MLTTRDPQSCEGIIKRGHVTSRLDRTVQNSTVQEGTFEIAQLPYQCALST